jgi:hypothetical protein
VIDHADVENLDAAENVPSLPLRTALNRYQDAGTPAEKRAANEQIVAVLKQKQWEWTTAD